MRIALFQPNIAGNVRAVQRIGAYFDTPVDLIEPMEFAWNDKRVWAHAIVEPLRFGRHRAGRGAASTKGFPDL